MTNKRTRFWMSAVFSALVTMNLAGCNLSQEIRDIISQILTGNGGGGCIAGCISCAQDCGCASCDCDCDCGACDCDCAGCNGCAIQPIPGGFTGAHPGARIANAAQIRVTDNALNFVGGQIPALARAVPSVPLPYFPLDIDGNGTPEGVVRVEFRNTDIFTPPVNQCDGNYANGNAADQACIRARLDINYRSCTYSASAPTQATNCNNGPDPLVISMDVPVVGNVTCNVTLNSEGIAPDSHDNLPVEADLAVINETTGPFAGFSRIHVLDSEITNNAALESNDVNVDCNGEGGLDTLVGLAAPIDCIQHREWDCGNGSGCAPFHGGTCRECNGVYAFGGCGGSWGACTPCTVDQAVWVTIRDFAAEDGDDQADDIDDLLDDVLDDLMQDPETILDDGQVCFVASAAVDCPTGSTYVAARHTCTINSSPGGSAAEKRCLSPLLGTQGRLNVGSLLAGISPGLNAVVDFLFAAGGNGVTAASGYNVNFFGGMENLSHDNCVPLIQEGEPGFVANPGTSLPQVSVFQNSTRPGTNNGFDIGAAVSEEFVNYALFKMWDSGLLCLTVTSSLSSQLAPGTFAPLFFNKSIGRFLFPLGANDSFLGLAIRPQLPPSTTAETIDDPGEPGDQVMAVNIALPKLNLDFIFWTNDRYTRLATMQVDLSIDLTLDIAPGADGDELKIKLGTIEFANGSMLNASTLLSESERNSNIASTLNAAAPLIADGLAGAIPPIALESLLNNALSGGVAGVQLPLRIDFTADSLLPFEEAGGHPFVGVFFNLMAAPPNPLTQRAETSVEVTSLTMPEDRTAFDALTLGQGPLPRVEIAMSAEGPEGAEYEYSYRTTFTAWSEWSRSKYAVIEDASLVLQQRQEVFARARIIGGSDSTDYTSARADIMIDVTEPAMQVTIAPDGRGELQAFDFVYGTNLEYRVDGGDWHSIGAGTVDLGQITNETVIEVRDGSGNVNANNKLRGRGDPDAAVGGCGCTTAGDSSNGSMPAAALSLAMLGLVIARRRKR